MVKIPVGEKTFGQGTLSEISNKDHLFFSVSFVLHKRGRRLFILLRLEWFRLQGLLQIYASLFNPTRKYKLFERLYFDFFFLSCFFPLLETLWKGQTGLEVAIQLRVTLNSSSFWPHLLGAAMRGMSHYAQFKDLNTKFYHSLGTRLLGKLSAVIRFV